MVDALTAFLPTNAQMIDLYHHVTSFNGFDPLAEFLHKDSIGHVTQSINLIMPFFGASRTSPYTTTTYPVPKSLFPLALIFAFQLKQEPSEIT